MEDWNKHKFTVKKAFMDDGVKAYIKKVTSGEYDITTGKKSSTSTLETVYVIFKTVKDENEHLIPANTFYVMCSYTKNTDPTDTENHFLVFNGKTYKILSARTVMPGGTILFYVLRCQR